MGRLKTSGKFWSIRIGTPHRRIGCGAFVFFVYDGVDAFALLSFRACTISPSHALAMVITSGATIQMKKIPYEL
jgi:hypothetical protein